jgi:hypothetical protein
MGVGVIEFESPHGLDDLKRVVGPQHNDEGTYMSTGPGTSVGSTLLVDRRPRAAHIKPSMIIFE